MSDPTPTPTPGFVARTSVERGWITAVAILAIVLGVIAFLVPGATLLTVAILFGIHLIASGVFRLIMAFTADRLPRSIRWLTGLLGGLVLVGGILTLANPWQSLAVLGIVIGAAWIVDGIASIAGRAGRTDQLRWLPVTAGIASIIAGVLVAIMPILALASFVIVAAILLIIVGISTLFLLSNGGRKAEPTAEPTASEG